MRFAVVGSGGWAGTRHVEALKLLGHEIVALVDPFPGCAEQARAVGARALASFEELDLDSHRRGDAGVAPAPASGTHRNARQGGQARYVREADGAGQPRGQAPGGFRAAAAA